MGSSRRSHPMLPGATLASEYRRYRRYHDGAATGRLLPLSPSIPLRPAHQRRSPRDDIWFPYLSGNITVVAT